MDKTQCVHVFEITRSRCLSCGGRNRACGEYEERRSYHENKDEPFGGDGPDRLNRLYAEMRHNYEQLNEWGKTDGLDVAMEKLRRCACDALQTEDIVVENVDDEKTVQTLSRSYKEQETEFLKRAVMMAAGRKACRQSLNVLNEESVRQKYADAMAAATGSNLSPLRSGYASALQSSPDMGAKDQGGR